MYIARKVLNPRSLGVGWLLVGSGFLFWFVSIISVVRNFWYSSSDFGSAYGFVASSFSQTTLAVQAISVGIVAVSLFFAVDLYRAYLYNRQG